MSRVVVDLTEFNTWAGHLTGVQRVVHGLGSALAESDNIHYISYAGGEKFHEVKWDDFSKKINQSSSQTTSLNTHAALIAAKKLYNKTPSFIRNYLTPERKDKYKRIAIKAYQSAKNAKNIRVKVDAKPKYPSFKFMPGDVIISAGRAWDDSEYMTALEGVRKHIGVKIAYVLYDLIPIYQQHTFGAGLTERFSRYLYRILKNADYILPISRSSKKDLLRFASDIGVIDVPKTEVIRLGDEVAEEISAKPPAFVRNPELFSISVGTIEARKNHMQIYYAYKLAAQRGAKLPDMYIIGKPGWLTGDVMHFIQIDTDVNHKISVINNVSDKDLGWLYKNALFTVYTSQCEGWGLPVAESLAYGTPAITSNTSSMAEISPKYSDQISPFDSAALLDKMVKYSDRLMSNKRRTEIEKGYKGHSWKQTANDIIRAVSDL